VFEPFCRAQPDNVDGHGLAIAQRVLAAHGGGIEAANRDGGGFCVRLILPLAPQAPQALQA